MAVPYVQEFGKVVDIGQIDLRFDRVLERTPTGLECRLQTRGDKELGLQPDIGAVPEGIRRPIGGLGEPVISSLFGICPATKT